MSASCSSTYHVMTRPEVPLRSRITEPRLDSCTTWTPPRSSSATRAAPTPRSSYTSLFFSEEPLDIARAKAVSAPCIARTQCLAAAIEREEPCGVWGGEIFVDGVPVAEKHRRGRPPRIPRPAIVVNEIPDVA